jgi:outer membrane immunogenic protein
MEGCSMKKFFLASLATLGTLAASSANAADLSVRPTSKQPPPMVAPAPVVNWTGFYIGAGGGYGMFNVDNEGISPGGVINSTNQTAGGRGWFGTVVGGYDFQFANPIFSNPIVAGVFVDADFSDIKGRLADVQEEVTGPLKQRWAWAVGGRIGFLVVPTVLSYFNGGFTQAHFTGGDLVGANGGPTGETIGSATFNGWFLGSGIEYMILPGLSVKTEYRFADYHTRDALVTGSNGLGAERLHPFVQTIRTELIYKFNWGKGKTPTPVVARY